MMRWGKIVDKHLPLNLSWFLMTEPKQHKIKQKQTSTMLNLWTFVELLKVIPDTLYKWLFNITRIPKEHEKNET